MLLNVEGCNALERRRPCERATLPRGDPEETAEENQPFFLPAQASRARAAGARDR